MGVGGEGEGTEVVRGLQRGDVSWDWKRGCWGRGLEWKIGRWLGLRLVVGVGGGEWAWWACGLRLSPWAETTERKQRTGTRTLEVANKSHTSRYPRMCSSSSFGRSDSCLGGLHHGTMPSTAQPPGSSPSSRVLEGFSTTHGQQAGINRAEAVTGVASKGSPHQPSVVAAYGWKLGSDERAGKCECAVPAGGDGLGELFLLPEPDTSSTLPPRSDIERCVVLAMSWTATTGSRAAPPVSIS